MELHEFQRLIRDAHLWSEITHNADVVVRVEGVQQTERPVRSVKVRDGVVIVEF